MDLMVVLVFLEVGVDLRILVVLLVRRVFRFIYSGE